MTTILSQIICWNCSWTCFCWFINHWRHRQKISNFNSSFNPLWEMEIWDLIRKCGVIKRILQLFVLQVTLYSIHIFLLLISHWRVFLMSRVIMLEILLMWGFASLMRLLLSRHLMSYFRAVYLRTNSISQICMHTFSFSFFEHLLAWDQSLNRGNYCLGLNLRKVSNLGVVGTVNLLVGLIWRSCNCIVTWSSSNIRRDLLVCGHTSVLIVPLLNPHIYFEELRAHEITTLDTDSGSSLPFFHQLILQIMINKR
jgi:hypothetical protein